MQNIFSKLNWLGKFFRLLNISNRDIVLASVLAFLFSCLEGFGVALLLPVLQFVEKGQGVFEGVKVNVFWKTIAWISNHTGLPVTLPLLLIFTFCVILTRAFVLYAKSIQSAKLQHKAVSSLRKQVFDSYVSTDFAFCERKGESSVINSLTLESTRVGNILFYFFQWLAAIFGLVFYFCVLCTLSLELTALVIATFSFMQIFLMKRIRATKKSGQTVSKNSQIYNFFITQKAAAAKLIRIFKTEKHEKNNFSQLVEQLEESELAIKKKLAFVQSQLDPVLILGAFLVLYVGSSVLRLNIADIGVFLLVLLRMFPFSKTANNMFQQMISAKPALDSIENFLLEADGFYTISSGTNRFEGLGSEISFKNVSFSYKNEQIAVNAVNFDWPKGSVLALVGHSGSGKSTLVDLLLRIRDVTSGEICIDGKNIKFFDLETYRRAIGYVSQDTFLFNDTIYNNIVYGGTSVDKQAVMRACQLSHSDDFINRLPNGLDTKVGDRGASFSGGERQRLCLARALVHNPDILILDEPTSALDSESEKFINQTLLTLKNLKKTILIIAHRFSTVKEADQILVLDKGRIVEVGTHANLMQQTQKTMYRHLYELQNLDSRAVE